MIDQAARFCYDCLATGYVMKLKSSILAQKVKQQTDDMVTNVIETSLDRRSRRKAQLSTYISQLKRLQIKWELMAQKRYKSQCINQLEHTLPSPQPSKQCYCLWQVVVADVAVAVVTVVVVVVACTNPSCWVPVGLMCDKLR